MSGEHKFPTRCTLMGCKRPRVKHHHHMHRGHLNTTPCACSLRGEPGASGEEKP